MKFLKKSKVAVNICHGDLLGVTALKRSTKGAMNSSFCNASSTSKTTTEMKFVMDLPKVLLRFISETFKIAALERIKPSIRKAIKEMQFLTELSKVLLKFVSEVRLS